MARERSAINGEGGHPIPVRQRRRTPPAARFPKAAAGLNLYWQPATDPKETLSEQGSVVCNLPRASRAMTEAILVPQGVALRATT